jgi:hypothetical protein
MSKPVHEADEICPLMNKKRKLVCHKCAFYKHVRGIHPQSGEDMDHWDCSIALLPMLMIETGRQINTTNAALVSLRNEFVEGNDKRISTDIMRTSALIRASQQQ